MQLPMSLQSWVFFLDLEPFSKVLIWQPLAAQYNIYSDTGQLNIVVFLWSKAHIVRSPKFLQMFCGFKAFWQNNRHFRKPTFPVKKNTKGSLHFVEIKYSWGSLGWEFYSFESNPRFFFKVWDGEKGNILFKKLGD